LARAVAFDPIDVDFHWHIQAAQSNNIAREAITEDFKQTVGAGMGSHGFNCALLGLCHLQPLSIGSWNARGLFHDDPHIRKRKAQLIFEGG